MEILIWIGVALSVLFYWFASSLCRAAKEMDRAFDELDMELVQRSKQNEDRRHD